MQQQQQQQGKNNKEQTTTNNNKNQHQYNININDGNPALIFSALKVPSKVPTLKVPLQSSHGLLGRSKVEEKFLIRVGGARRCRNKPQSRGLCQQILGSVSICFFRSLMGNISLARGQVAGRERNLSKPSRPPWKSILAHFCFGVLLAVFVVVFLWWCFCGGVVKFLWLLLTFYTLGRLLCQQKSAFINNDWFLRTWQCRYTHGYGLDDSDLQSCCG